MLEWLKDILGDGYTEEIDKQVSNEIGKRMRRAPTSTARTRPSGR